jgi:hypothetical protein
MATPVRSIGLPLQPVGEEGHIVARAVGDDVEHPVVAGPADREQARSGARDREAVGDQQGTAGQRDRLAVQRRIEIDRVAGGRARDRVAQRAGTAVIGVRDRQRARLRHRRRSQHHRDGEKEPPDPHASDCSSQHPDVAPFCDPWLAVSPGRA